MTQKIRMAMAGALALIAVPALGYEEAFVTWADPGPAATVVESGEYSEGYVIETPAREDRQTEPVVAGAYTEPFVGTGAPARALGAAESAPYQVAAKR